jgi:hypothetical protein
MSQLFSNDFYWIAKELNEGGSFSYYAGGKEFRELWC